MKSEPIKESRAAQTLRQLYTGLATAFIRHPEKLRVEINQAANFVTLTAKAHAEDCAKLIGHGGQNFHAMRCLLQFAADRLNVRLHLSRVRDLPGTRLQDNQQRFMADPDWPRSEIHSRLKTACDILFTACVIGYEHGKEKTTIKISVGSGELFVIPKVQVEESLDMIFVAIGNNKGRKLGVILTQNPNLNQTKSENANHSVMSSGRR